MTDLQFTFEAIENNPDSAKIICDFYGKSNAELANALTQRVLRHKGKNAKLVIDFTDVNTNQTIKYTKS